VSEKIEISYQPKVSLDRNVHYTTQQGKYELLSTGVGELLSDSRIHYYALQGFYGSKRQAEAEALETTRRDLRKAREKSVKDRVERKRKNEEFINDLLKELL
jgi:hypothetical protein